MPTCRPSLCTWRSRKNSRRMRNDMTMPSIIRNRLLLLFAFMSATLTWSLSAAGASAWDAPVRAIPDVTVHDQDGRPLKFYSDLIKGRVVAINFVYTTCTTVCPTLAMLFRHARTALGTQASRVQFISVSVDPVNDTPARLKAFADKFGAGLGWAMVTANKSDLDILLKALSAPTGDKLDHSPAVLVGDDTVGRWTRIDSLGKPQTLVDILREAMRTVAAARPPVQRVPSYDALVKVGTPSQTRSDTSATENYFTNLPLLTHEGKPVRFYDDLVKGKIVLINTMFTNCTSVCSPMTANLAKVQRYLGERVGHDIHMVSITMDPEHDTPDVLKRYATKYSAAGGWTFLTGKKENVDWVLYKLGAFVEDKLQHSTVLISGNDRSGRWMKLVALDDPNRIADTVRKLAESAQ